MSLGQSGYGAKAFVETDFDELLRFIKNAGIQPADWQKSDADKLKTVHRGIYALAVWDFKLKLPDNAKFFLSEARSDALASIPLVLLGFRKQAALSVRQVLEDVLRHVYYSNHEVEYGWLRRQKYFMRWNDLIDYLSESLLFGRPKLKGRIKGSLNKIYSELSRYVHVKSPDYAMPSLSLKEMGFDRKFYDYYCEQTIEAMNCCNALLSLFRWDDYMGLDVETRRTVKQSISPDLYKLVSKA